MAPACRCKTAGPAMAGLYCSCRFNAKAESSSLELVEVLISPGQRQAPSKPRHCMNWAMALGSGATASGAVM